MGTPLGAVGARMTQGGHSPHPHHSADSQSVRPKFSDIQLLHNQCWEGKVRVQWEDREEHSLLIFHVQC